jgi:excisionase family DNA binding protein
VGEGNQVISGEVSNVERLLDKAEVADLLKVSVRTVDRLRLSSELKAVPVRGRVRFRPEDVNAFINRKAD